MAQAGNKHGELSPLALFAFFVNRCKENLHVVVAFSPIGDAFRNRLRQFPSLINCCTIDWFQVCNLQCVCVCVCVCVCELLSCIQLFATLWVVSRQASLSMGFFRQEYWSGLPFPSPGALPSPGIKPGCPALQADSLPSGPSEITKSFGLLQRSYLISINMHLSSVFWLLTLIAAPGTWKTP